MKKLLMILVALSVCAIFFSCSSPESDGKKAGKKVGKMLCHCEKKYPIKEVAVGMYMQQTRGEHYKEYDECVSKAYEHARKASKKYTTNKQKLSEFEYAYAASLRAIDRETCR